MNGSRIVLLVAALAFAAPTARAGDTPPTAQGPGAAARLAPTRPDLVVSAARLRAHLETGEAILAAVTALQTRWTARPEPAPCDAIEDGWRLEHFGAALREVAQAARVEARTYAGVRGAATVAPLVTASERAEGDALLRRSAELERALATAGAWQVAYVRAALAGCTVTPLTPDPPAASHTPAAERLALLAPGDGFACGADGPTRADGAVVVLKGTLACWAPTRECACVPQELTPGAVIGPLADTPPAAAGASTAP